MVTFKGLKYGAFAGFIATWSISSVVAVTEILLGLNIGTFYSIMGISLGVNNITAATSYSFCSSSFDWNYNRGDTWYHWDQMEKGAYAQPVQECIGWHRSGYRSMASILPSNNYVPSSTGY